MTQKQKTLSFLKEYPEIMTIAEVAHALRLGKNKTYHLVKEGKINSMRLGSKIIVPKMCLVTFLLDEKNYQKDSQIVSENLWTLNMLCGIIGTANDAAVADKTN